MQTTIPRSVARLGARRVHTDTITGTITTFALVRKPAVEAGVVLEAVHQQPEEHAQQSRARRRARRCPRAPRSLLRKMSATATNAMPKRSATMPNGGMDESPTCIIRSSVGDARDERNHEVRPLLTSPPCLPPPARALH